MIDKPVLSVDWDVRTLRMVHARVRGQAVTIDQVLSVAIPAEVRIDEAASLGAFLGQAVSKAGIRTKRVVVDIPRERVNFHTLKLPTASMDELAGMVAFQIPRELHFPVDQAVVDFILPPEMAAAGSTNDVLVAAVHVDELQFYRDVFERAGLKLQRVGLRPNASQFAVNALLSTTPYERVLFVDVGPRTTEIDVLHNGHLVFSRAADVAIPDRVESPDADRGADRGADNAGDAPELALVGADRVEDAAARRVERELLIEVTRSIEAYRAAHPGAPIEHAVIGGSCDVEEALAEAIQRQYEISAQAYNPAHCFGWDADRGSAAGAFASAIGLVLAQARDPRLKFDFLNPKKAVSRAERRIKKAPMAAATVVLFVAAGVVFYVMSIKPQYELRDQLAAELARVEQTLEAQQEFIALVKTIQEYEDHRIVWVDALHDLITALPDQKEIVLSGIDMSQRDHSIKVPFRGKDIRTGSVTASRLDEFRLPGEERQQFEVELGDLSTKSNDEYPNVGRLEINIVDRDWPEVGKGRRRRP